MYDEANLVCFMLNNQLTTTQHKGIFQLNKFLLPFFFANFLAFRDSVRGFPIFMKFLTYVREKILEINVTIC
jgi:hypothetical protein